MNWLWLFLGVLVLSGLEKAPASPALAASPVLADGTVHQHVPGFHLAGGLLIGQVVTVRIGDFLHQGSVVGGPVQGASGANLWAVELADGTMLDAVPETALSVL